MKRIKWIFLLLMVLGTILYWISLTDVECTLAPWALRKSLLYYTGIMSFVAMSVGVILALRLRIELGLYERTDFATPNGTIGFFQHNNFFQPLEDLAKDMGEWALYVLLILAVLALWKKFPYRYFFKTHRILVVIYLMLAFHTLILFGKIAWLTPIGILAGALLIIGIPAALLSLFQRIGANHRTSGQISQICLHENGKVTEVEVRLSALWEGHRDGQFAFETFDTREGHHPFTLSSSWKDDATLTFHIRQLGDYTRTLNHTLYVGDAVTVEGPYGKFDFTLHSGPQIWITGGIGITPFLSRLEALAHNLHQSQQPISLFYSARASDHALVERVTNSTQQAGVALHLSFSGKNPGVTAQSIFENVPDFLNIKCHPHPLQIPLSLSFD